MVPIEEIVNSASSADYCLVSYLDSRYNFWTELIKIQVDDGVMDNEATEATWNLIDRPRGILTSDDRAFILGKKSYENDQSARRTRARIRERALHSLIDLYLIRRLEDRDLDQIIDLEDESRGIGLQNGIVSAYYVLYDLLTRKYESNENIDMNVSTFMRQAIEAIDLERGYRSEIHIDIKRDELDSPDEIMDRISEEGLGAVTATEFDYLFTTTDADPARLRSLLSDLFDDQELDIQSIRKEQEALEALREGEVPPHRE